MSELINSSARREEFRWQLLTTVSALALLASVYGAREAKADDDGDHPTVWIELGGQFERADAGEEQFVPPFILATPRPGPETISPLSVGHSPRFSVGGESKISFEPAGTNWVFSAAIRFGRSNDNKHLHQQSYPTQPVVPPYFSHFPSNFRKAMQFSDVEWRESETHAVMDFQAGKDVGLGMFGVGSSSTFSLGVRYAQFGSKSKVAFKSDPDAHAKYITLTNGLKLVRSGYYHSNAAVATATRSFRGFGPSISWNASAAVIGNPKDGEVAFDWGLNAAILFGRQKAFVHHQATAQYHKGKYSSGYVNTFRTVLYHHDTKVPPRSRNVLVPNVGGFAGVSYLFSDAKLSVGYRADLFFGAMDGGIDAAKKENRSFYGPFASVSVGIGG